MAKTPSGSHDQDRSRLLDGFEIEIFKLVEIEASSGAVEGVASSATGTCRGQGQHGSLHEAIMGTGADGSAGWHGCDGRTLLGSAAHGKSEKMVLALLEAGAKPDLDVKFGEESE